MKKITKIILISLGILVLCRIGYLHFWSVYPSLLLNRALVDMQSVGTFADEYTNSRGNWTAIQGEEYTFSSVNKDELYKWDQDSTGVFHRSLYWGETFYYVSIDTTMHYANYHSYVMLLIDAL
ncbi:MAG: hypothetical protein MJZ92_04690 [Paludibacteraceae bacterium]|nr:hypothetical protein [Paludibacteraceae bacterium]